MYPNYQAPNFERRHSVLRIVQWILCCVCLGFSIYNLIAKLNIPIITTAIITLTAFAFWFITLFDIILTRYKPFPWFSWAMLAIMASLLFALCAGLLIRVLMTAIATDTKIALIATMLAVNLVTCVAYLLDLCNTLRSPLKENQTPKRKPRSGTGSVQSSREESQPNSKEQGVQFPTKTTEPTIRFCTRSDCPRKKFPIGIVHTHGGTFHVSKNVAPIFDTPVYEFDTICSKTAMVQKHKETKPMFSSDHGNIKENSDSNKYIEFISMYSSTRKDTIKEKETRQYRQTGNCSTSFDNIQELHGLELDELAPKAVVNSDKHYNHWKRSHTGQGDIPNQFQGLRNTITPRAIISDNRNIESNITGDVNSNKDTEVEREPNVVQDSEKDQGNPRVDCKVRTSKKSITNMVKTRITFLKKIPLRESTTMGKIKRNKQCIRNTAPPKTDDNMSAVWSRKLPLSERTGTKEHDSSNIVEIIYARDCDENKPGPILEKVRNRTGSRTIFSTRIQDTVKRGSSNKQYKTHPVHVDDMKLSESRMDLIECETVLPGSADSNNRARISSNVQRHTIIDSKGETSLTTSLSSPKRRNITWKSSFHECTIQ